MKKINSANITIDFLQSIGIEKLVVNHKGEEFSFKVNIKNNSNKLAIHTNGAVDFSIKNPPVFQRSTLANKIDAHCIFIDDKTVTDVFDPKFPTAWLIGTKDRHYAKDYFEIIQIIQKVLKVETEDVFYWGSSAGGTSSIVLSTLHKGTTAIANNPQTNIYNYRRKDYVLKNIFPNLTEDEILSTERYRLSLGEFMHHCNYVPRVFYIQNYLHSPDLENHVHPFINELDSYNLNKEKITFWFYHDSERGHQPLITDKTLEYLNTIMSYRHL